MSRRPINAVVCCVYISSSCNVSDSGFLYGILWLPHIGLLYYLETVTGVLLTDRSAGVAPRLPFREDD